MGAVDLAALSLAVVIAAAITGVVAFFASTQTRRDWVVAGGLALVIMTAGIVNLLTEKPRETHIATAVVGSLLPVAGALSLARAMRRVRAWLRWLVVFLIAFVLLIGGLLLGASILPRFIGS